MTVRGGVAQISAVQSRIKGGFKFIPELEYTFEVVDSITEVSFTVSEANDPSKYATVSANVSSDGPSKWNHIAFHNRYLVVVTSRCE